MKGVVAWVLLLSLPAHAINRIDIHVGEIRHPAAVIQNLSATLDVEGRWQGMAGFKQGDWAQLAKEAALPVAVSKGVVDGKAEFSGTGTQLRQLKLSANVRDVAFSDAAGLHAGEKVGGRVNLEALRAGERWQWQGSLDWPDGEVFWQPLYFPAGGHALKARGWLSHEMLEVEEGSAELGGIGLLTFRGSLKLADKAMANLELSGRSLQAGKGYELLAKPFLEKTLLGNLEVAGNADMSASVAGGQIKAFSVALHDFDIEDKSGHFAFYKVNAEVPWTFDSVSQAKVRFAGGRVLNLTLGSAALAAELNGLSLTTPEWRIPLLDGELVLRDVSLAQVAGQWHGHLAAKLSSVSMGEFSHALGWPRMEGKLAATVPLVTYTNCRLAMDGAMQFDVFDGQVTVGKLSMQNPLGLASRLNADIAMRNLDLDMLTRTFSFGAMSGRLDGDVNGLELSSWKPVKFDAGFRSSPGNYPKKISQRAVENISALGGAGAAAAIQRSFLRFLNDFNYGKIGLSCKLRNGVCAMDGVEPAQSGYVIVKGSSIPAITVLGYNRSVSWGELLERVQRITQGNAKPVIK